MKIDNILFIGQGRNLFLLLDWCQQNQIRYRTIRPTLEIASPHLEFSEMRHRRDIEHPLAPECTILPADIFFTDRLYDWFLKEQFTPEWIISFSDIECFNEVELRIGQWFHCNNAITHDQYNFFSRKSEQDRVCKLLEIPTLPTTSDSGLCVKRDAKSWNWTEDAVPKFRWEPLDYTPKSTEFVQGWQDIEYDYSIHCSIDAQGSWSVWDINCRYYSHGMVTHEINPTRPTPEEKQQIESIFSRLAKHLNINSRFIIYQLAKLRGSSTLYSMDFNSRLGGDAYIKSHGKEVGSFELIPSLITHEAIPSTLEYQNIFHGITAYQWRSQELLKQSVKPIPLKQMTWWIDPTVSWTWKIGSHNHTETTIKI
jgi:hypothetical protein